MALVRMMLFAAVALVSGQWDAQFDSERFRQRYRVASDGKVWAESEVCIREYLY